MLKLNVQDETSRLRSVVLGTAKSCGPIPKPEEAYDPKSLEHILAGTYPIEADMVKEMDGFAQVFAKYDVQVFRPRVLKDCNQIFSRDIAFVIDNKLVKANILPDREKEFQAIKYVLNKIDEDQIIYPQKRFMWKEAMLCHGENIFLWVLIRVRTTRIILRPEPIKRP